MFDDTIHRVESLLIEHASSIRASFIERETVGEENPSGEIIHRGDLIVDELLEQVLTNVDEIGQYASEERIEPINGHGRLAVAVDPLDGSSNLRANNTVGTIVSLYDSFLPASGDSLIAAWYLVFGPLTSMVSTDGEIVRETLIRDGDVYEEQNISMPADPIVYGVGGKPSQWTPAFRSFIQEISTELKVRYSGAMVADVNQVLAHGGLFSYPALATAPAGKLRIQFEAIPIAAIITAAGGASTTGTESILSLSPTTLHERTPVHVGTDFIIRRLEAATNQEVR